MAYQQITKLVPSPAVGLAPKTTTLVNIQTIMWAATPRQRTLASVQLLGQRVDLRISLVSVTWRFGDGTQQTTSDPGKAYDATGDPCRTPTCPDYFGHTYAGTGRLQVSAAATWAGQFRVGGGAWQQIPQQVTGPPATAALRVVQARDELVPH